MNGRIPGYPVHAQFLERWSPRAFTAETIAQETLLTILEAARWAPSSFNAQPWRFLTSRRGDTNWTKFLVLANEGNRPWAEKAAALVVLVSARTARSTGGSEALLSKTHSFDAGCAWGYLALQASLLGWAAHGMAGFDREGARSTLAVPEAFSIEAMIALGKPGEAAILPEPWPGREQPSLRLPLANLVFNGPFGSSRL